MRRPGKSFSDVCGDGNEHGVRDWLDWIHEKPERVQHLNVGLSNGLKGLEGYSGLMMAIRGGHNSIVRLLVKEPGLDFDHVADDGATALYVAVGMGTAGEWGMEPGCNQVALDILLALPGGKINLNIKTACDPPVVRAAALGCVQSFSKLVNHEGIDLDTKNKEGLSLQKVIKKRKERVGEGYIITQCKHNAGTNDAINYVLINHLNAANLKGKVVVIDDEGSSEVRKQMEENRAVVRKRSNEGETEEEEVRRKKISKVREVVIDNEEKMDSLQLEYTYLLTSQLEDQRNYFQSKLGRVEEDSSRQVQALQERLQQEAEAKEKLEKELDLVSRERSKCETKVGQLVSKVSKLGGQLEEERQLNKSLRENQDEWQTRLKKAEVEVAVLQKTKDREILELQEQASVDSNYL